jgi:hypothetical protein
MNLQKGDKMKKYLLIFLAVLLLAYLVFSDASPDFKKLEIAIKSTVPEGFTVNKGQTWDNKMFQKITYDRGKSGMNRLIFSLNPNNKSFSEMDLALDHKKITFQGRKALFNDGSRTGMSSIKIILKNNSGSFTITHRSLEGKAMNQSDLEKLLSGMKLEILEK